MPEELRRQAGHTPERTGGLARRTRDLIRVGAGPGDQGGCRCRWKHRPAASAEPTSVHRLLLNTDPEYAQARSELEDLTDAETARGFAAAAPRSGRFRRSCTSSTRPPRRTSRMRRSRARSSILNEDFRKTNADASKVPAVFQPLARRLQDPVQARDEGHLRRATTGITRTQDDQGLVRLQRRVKSSDTGGADPWPARRFLNVWVCNLGGGLLGYAQFPGGPGATDGVVILNSAFGDTGTATDAVRPRPHHHPRGRPLAEPVPHLGRRRDGLQRLGPLRRTRRTRRARTTASRRSRTSRARTARTATCSWTTWTTSTTTRCSCSPPARRRA